MPAAQVLASDPAVNVPEDALHAARQVVRSFGLPSDMSLIRAGSNIVFRLAAPDLVVRCTPAGSHHDPSAEVTTAVAAADLPAVPPCAPSESVDGWTVTLWPYLKASRVVGSPWRALGNALSQVHKSDVHQELSGLPHIAEVLTGRIEQRLATSDLVPSAALTAMTAAAAETVSGSGDVLVHGDARPANLIGFHLIDWEQCGLGPACFDAASAVVCEQRFGDADAVAQYQSGYGPDDMDPAVLAACVRLTEIACITWVADLAVRNPTLRDEARYRVRTLLDQGSQQRPWWNS